MPMERERYYSPAICSEPLCKDAIVLIRQQQERIKELEAAKTARVLKLRELYEGQVIWFEGFRSEGYRSLWVAEVSKVCSDEIVFFGGNNEVHMPIHAYEERYRCWTQRPTFKQREAHHGRTEIVPILRVNAAIMLLRCKWINVHQESRNDLLRQTDDA